MDEADSTQTGQYSSYYKSTATSRTTDSSNYDTRALAKHGKRQQLKRRFGFISAIAFSSILLTSWETIAVTIGPAFINGGPVTLIYGFFLSWTGTLALCLSLAEMSSMAPVASAQYHFVAMLIPSKASKLLSWVSGWITAFAWQANVASVGYTTATQIQALVVLNYQSYVYERWHGTMIFWAVVIFCICVNVFGVKILPHLEILVGILHVCLWFVWVVPLVYLSPHRSAASTFTDFEKTSGWGNNAVSWCVGLLTVIYPLLGFEGVCHINEEVRNASVAVPRSMVISVVLNGVLGFGFLLGLLFSTTDIEGALKSPTKSPMVEILYQALESKAATTALMSLFAVVSICAEMGMVASTSRLTWAFARDNGLPFSRFFAYVHPSYRIPINAILLNTIVAMLLNLINIASSTAFSAILSLTTISLHTSYMLPIAVMIWRRLGKRELKFGPFALGRFGLPINVVGLLWGIFAVVFVVFPTEMPVTADNMNYASLVFGSAILFSLGSWFLYGKKVFSGPINELDKGTMALT